MSLDHTFAINALEKFLLERNSFHVTDLVYTNKYFEVYLSVTVAIYSSSRQIFVLKIGLIPKS